MTIKILNLHAGIGGNRKGWIEKDVEVTAIEHNSEIANVYQEFFPQDKVIVADAGDYLAKHYAEFDFIWASPSCTTHSKVRMMASKAGSYDAKLPNMELYSIIIFLQHFFKGKWIVENVKPYYNPLIQPTAKLGRHLIWSNFEFEEKDFNDNKSHNERGYIKDSWFVLTNFKLKHRKDQIIRNCVNPEISKFLLEQAFMEQSHKSHTLASPTFPTEKAINRNLQVTPFKIVHKLKGNTSIQLRRCFPDLRYLGYKQHYGSGFDNLWARGYYCGSAGHVSQEQVKRYIQEQMGKDVFEYDIYGCPTELKGQLKIGDFCG